MNKKFKLAILNSHPIQYFAPLYRRLSQESEIDLTVYYCSRQGVIEYIDPGFGEPIKWDIPLLEGYQYKFLPNLRHKGKVGGFFSLVNPLVVYELYREQYDALLVHGHTYATYLLAILTAKMIGTAVLMRCETHLLLHRSSFKRRVRRPVMTLFYKLCNACLAIGTRNNEFYRFHGVPQSKLFSVPYTVNNDFFMQAIKQYEGKTEPIKSELGFPLNKPLILYASKLIKRKRPMDLLMAYHRLCEQGVEAVLIYIGSGEMLEELKRYKINHKLDNVYFLGFRNQSELPKFYAIADVFVLPSENEPWGLIINEVMCAGVPVIATDEIGATADLVKHGYNGFTFQTGDIEMLSQYLRTIMTNPNLQAQMGKCSRDLITNWDFERSVEGLHQAVSYLRN